MSNLYCKSNKIRPIEGFIQVARNKSITTAAKKMYVTQAAVSQQVAALEKALGVKLFYRSKNQLHLTAEGIKVYEIAAPRLQAITEIYKLFIEYSMPRKLDIAANHTSILYILPQLLKCYLAENPDTEIMVRNIGWDDAIGRLLNDEIDLAIYPVNRDLPTECVAKVLVEFDPILLIRKDHPLAMKEEVSLEDVAHYNIIRIDPHLITLPLFEQTLQAYNIKNNIHLESGDWEILKKFVEADLGVAIVSNICLSENETNLIGRKLLKHFPKMDYCLIYKKGREDLSNIKAFLNSVKMKR